MQVATNRMRWPDARALCHRRRIPSHMQFAMAHGHIVMSTWSMGHPGTTWVHAGTPGVRCSHVWSALASYILPSDAITGVRRDSASQSVIRHASRCETGAQSSRRDICESLRNFTNEIRILHNMHNIVCKRNTPNGRFYARESHPIPRMGSPRCGGNLFFSSRQKTKCWSRSISIMPRSISARH